MGTGQDITQLLQMWRAGEPSALERLAPLVHGQLYVIASSYMRRERTDHTLQPTALVSELYLRLLQQRQVQISDRAHFYAFAAKIMRNILRDHARRHLSERRGGGMAVHLPLAEDVAWVGSSAEEMLALDEVLEQLKTLDERKARVVELRCFLALTMEETAEVLETSLATAERDLKFARAWLFQALHAGQGGLGRGVPS